MRVVQEPLGPGTHRGVCHYLPGFRSSNAEALAHAHAHCTSDSDAVGQAHASTNSDVPGGPRACWATTSFDAYGLPRAFGRVRQVSSVVASSGVPAGRRCPPRCSSDPSIDVWCRGGPARQAPRPRRGCGPGACRVGVRPWKSHG